MLQLKNISFSAIKTIFLEDVDIDILVPCKISFGEEKSECFIPYLFDNYEIKSLHIILPKT